MRRGPADPVPGAAHAANERAVRIERRRGEAVSGDRASRTTEVGTHPPMNEESLRRSGSGRYWPDGVSMRSRRIVKVEGAIFLPVSTL